jgi:hypothetical protein
MQTMIDAYETSGQSPPGTTRQDRRAYVLLERPRFDEPTPAQRELLIKFLADLLVEAMTRKRTQK